MTARRSNVLVVLGITGVVGCAGSVPPAASVANPATRASPVPPAADDPLSVRLRELQVRLLAEGLRPAADADAGRGFLAEGETATIAVGLSAGRCTTFVGLASPGVRDLDATLFRPSGESVAEDTNPDPHPVLGRCEPSAARAYLVLKAYSGAGAYRIAAFDSAEDRQARVREILGGGRRRAEAAQVPALRLSEIDAQMRRRGFEPVGEPFRGALEAGADVRFPLHARAGRCYTAAALAADGIRDLDVSIDDLEGNAVATDVGSEVDAFAQFCAERAAEYALRVRSAAGQGGFALRLFDAEARGLGGEGALWLGARPREAPSRRSLVEAVRDIETRLLALGYAAAGAEPAPSTPAVQQGTVATRRLAVGPNACVLVVAAGGPGIGRLTLSAYDAAGDLLGIDEGRSARALVHVCPARRTDARLDVVPLRGSGQTALRMYRLVRPPSAAPWTRGLDGSTVARALDQRLRAQLDGYAIADDDDGVWVVRPTPRGLREKAVTLRRDRCYRVAAAAGGAARAVRVRLVAPSGAERADLAVELPPLAVETNLCPDEEGAWRIDASAGRSGGEVVVQLAWRAR